MKTLLIKSSIATAIALTITACTPADNEGLAGIGGSGYVSSGSVSGFGSVFVNGVEFETDSSTFDVDGISGTQDNLAIGMVVKVSGSINADGVTGTAAAISYDDELQGPVSGQVNYDADRLTGSFTVLGVNVIIDSSSTSFDVSSDVTLPENTAFGFDTITDKNNVEISGFFDSNGNLRATRVELKEIAFDSTSSIVEIKGTIAGLNSSTFNLNGFTGLTVDATSADLDDLPNGLANDQLVEVKGTYDVGTNTVKATKVEAEDNSVEDTDEFEIEGLIANYNSASSTFTINGINVDASNAELEPDTLILANDLRVEVEGAIINGTLVATEIESEGGDIKVHAMVTSVPPATAPNTFKVSPVSGQSITITVSTGTQFDDDVDENKFFNIGDLVADSDFVEVEGYADGSGGVTAVEIDVKEQSNVLVQGYATVATGTAMAGGKMTVLGVTFSFDDGSITVFEKDSDIDGQPDIELKTGEINDLIDAINIAPQLVKIGDDEVLNGIGDGTADEIEIE